jgi:hypothetical protein
MVLHFLYYNFVRIHKTLRTSPAMAGVTDRLWEMADVVSVLEAWGKRRALLELERDRHGANRLRAPVAHHDRHVRGYSLAPGFVPHHLGRRARRLRARRFGAQKNKAFIVVNGAPILDHVEMEPGHAGTGPSASPSTSP